jgi:hypothetical protein
MRQIFVIVVLVAGSLYLNVVQWNKTHKLLTKLQDAALLEPWKPGDELPPLSSETTNDGAAELLGAQLSRPRVLYWTSPRCGWSTLNEPSFRRLYELEHEQFDFVAIVSTSETLTEARSMWNAPYPILAPPPPALQRQARFSGTPSTLVVDRQRRVLRSWDGAYLGDIKSDVEAFFHVTLPTLTPKGHAPS